MEKNYTILQELSEIGCTLPQAGNMHLYTVPAAYFTELGGQVMQKIQSGEEERYYFSSQNPYLAPAGYFELLPQLISQKIAFAQSINEDVASETAAIAPILNSVNKSNVYSTPAGYFEGLRISAEHEKKLPAKVISVAKPNLQKVMKYAVAAVVTGLLVVGGYRITEKETTVSQADAATNTEVDKLSDDDIMNFLKSRSSYNIASFTLGGQDNELKQSFSEIPDQDIQQFLQDNGEGEDI